jgi:hypothetical protein
MPVFLLGSVGVFAGVFSPGKGREEKIMPGRLKKNVLFMDGLQSKNRRGWCWLRFQPHSKLSRWFNERFASGGSLMRRIGIVSLASKLISVLWR